MSHVIKKWAKELNRHFSKKDTQMANSHIHPALRVIKEMLIKTTMRYHVTSVSMGTIKKKKPENNEYWQECEEIGILVHCCWECKMMLSLWKTVWRCIKKFKIELPHGLVIPLLVYPKELEAKSPGLIYISMFLAILFTVVKKWEEAKCLSTGEWINTVWYRYMMEFYSSLKKKEILLHAAAWMNLKNIVLSEVSQS